MNEAVTAAPTDHVYVERSPIHGYGLFARTPIQADTLIGRYEGPIVYDDADDGTYVLWVLDDDGQGYGIDGKNAMRYINHTRQPNAVFYEEEVWALRDIAPGEEITVHYGDDWDAIDDEALEEDQDADDVDEQADDEQPHAQGEPEAASV